MGGELILPNYQGKFCRIIKAGGGLGVAKFFPDIQNFFPNIIIFQKIQNFFPTYHNLSESTKIFPDINSEPLKYFRSPRNTIFR